MNISAIISSMSLILIFKLAPRYCFQNSPCDSPPHASEKESKYGFQKSISVFFIVILPVTPVFFVVRKSERFIGSIGKERA